MKSGIAFHCHHDRLAEYIYDYNGRGSYIKKRKPLEERGLRLRLFRIIPRDRLPEEGLEDCIKAGKAYYEAERALVKADKDYIGLQETYIKAGEIYGNVWEDYYTRNKAAFERLHKELCPGCPWDGETIFPGRRETL